MAAHEFNYVRVMRQIAPACAGDACIIRETGKGGAQTGRSWSFIADADGAFRVPAALGGELVRTAPRRWRLVGADGRGPGLGADESILAAHPDGPRERFGVSWGLGGAVLWHLRTRRSARLPLTSTAIAMVHADGGYRGIYQATTSARPQRFAPGDVVKVPVDDAPRACPTFYPVEPGVVVLVGDSFERCKLYGSAEIDSDKEMLSQLEQLVGTHASDTELAAIVDRWIES